MCIQACTVLKALPICYYYYYRLQIDYPWQSSSWTLFIGINNIPFIPFNSIPFIIHISIYSIHVHTCPYSNFLLSWLSYHWHCIYLHSYIELNTHLSFFNQSFLPSFLHSINHSFTLSFFKQSLVVAVNYFINSLIQHNISY